MSSQDLSRPLKTDRDLERNKDELLKVKLKDGEVFLAKLKEILDDSYIFDIEDKEAREVRKDEIKEIYIEIVF